MKRAQYIIVIIISLIAIYMGFGLRRFLSVNDGYKIVQVDNLYDGEIYEYLYMKYPLIVLNTYSSDELLAGFTTEKILELFGEREGYYSILGDDLVSDKAPRFDKIKRITELLEGDRRWKCLLNHTFIKSNDLYNPVHNIIARCSPKLSLNNRYSITISSAGYVEPLQYSQSYKIIITSLKGTKMIRLFNPKYKRNLYMDTKFHPNYRMSSINIWEEWSGLCEKYSKLKDTVYIDLILREGNSILIPNFWLFSTRNEDTNITLYSKVDTVLTHVLQLPYAVEKSLHFMGLYKVNNCYCHKCVKG